MKEVKIFIASSVKEFQQERRELGEYISTLNQLYTNRGVHLTWNMPENMPRSLTKNSSQNAYDRQIRDSQFFFLIIGRNLGKYTRMEFENAYEHFLRNNQPVICAWFLLPSGEFPSDNTFAFRQELLKSGYYPQTCSSLDTIKLEILMQLIRGGTFDITDTAVESAGGKASK